MNNLKDDLSTTGRKYPQYVAAIAVCIGSLAAGGVVGWTATITEDLLAKEFNNLDIDETSLSWISSLVPLGAGFMCFPIGTMCDKLGRKLSLLLFVVPFTAGWLLIVFAQNLAMLYAGRFVTGMAGGAFCVAAPLYTSEIAEKDIRGVLGSYYQLFLGGGTLLANVVSYYASVKVYTVAMATLPLMFGVVFVFQPETPLFRMKQGREDEARQALVRLRGKSCNVDPELQEIKTFLESEKRTQTSMRESLRKRSTKVGVFVCFSLMVFQQFSGIKATVFYTADIFKASGSEIDEVVSSIIFAALSTMSLWVGSILVDKLGRRVALILSGVFMAAGLAVIGGFFSLQRFGSDEALADFGFAPLLGLSIYTAFYSVGFAPIPWIMPVELFPAEIREVASAAVATFNWFLSFLMTKFYLQLSLAVGRDVTFYIFAGFAVGGSAFSYFFVPETKGKSLEQIQHELNGTVNKDAPDMK